MTCDEIREFLAGYQDGELEAGQHEAVERHLAECEACRRELARLEKVKEVTGKVQYNDLPLEVWDRYWHDLYRRIERGLGWIFMSIGAIILVALGLFHLLREFFFNPLVPILAKLGVGGLLLGGIFLLTSLIRERLFAYRRDRYREVQR